MKSFVFFIISVCIINVSFAQKIAKLFTIDDGLPSNRIYTVSEDINNDIWVGTNWGLSKYDGNTFTNYDTSDGLPSIRIIALDTDDNGNVYIGTSKGAAIYDGNTFSIYSALSGQYINNILYDQQNRIWFTTNNNGIYCLDDTIWHHYLDTTGTTNFKAFCLYEDNTGNIYAGSSNSQLLKFDGTNWSVFKVDTFNLSYCIIFGITEDINGTIWICGKSLQHIDSINVEHFYYIAEFNGNNFTIYKSNYGFGNTFLLKSSMIINNDNLLISSLNGIVQFNLTTHKMTILDDLNLFYTGISGLFNDNNNNLWVGTNGLALINNFNQLEIHNYFENLDTNNYSARFNSMGDMFWNLRNVSELEIPKGSGKTSIFAGNLWVGGLDSLNNLYTAATTYYPNTEFWAGPIADDYDISYFSKYNRLWKINKSDVDYHILHYNDGNYQMPEAIANWPGSGNTANGEAAYLAPYFDANINGIYDPQHGDFPEIKGDQAVYFILNDVRLDTHQTTLSLPMDIEVHAMAYAFNESNNENINNTFFINYKIHNRSYKDYHDVYIGQLAVFDLGDPFDDFVGCDSTRNLFFAYNGDDMDGNGTGSSYGANPPAQGVIFLNSPMYSFMYYSNSYTHQGDPIQAKDFYNYMQAIWKDGSHLTYGGTGYSGSINTNYHFEINSGWTEETEGNFPGDRRGIGATGPFTLNSEDYICIDVAYPWARDTNGAYSSLLKLLNTTDEIKAFYDAQYFECTNNNSISKNKIPASLCEIYPNPTTGEITVKAEDMEIIEIMDIQGRKILTQKIKKKSREYKININEYPKGIYIIKITTCKGMAIRKVALE